MGAITIEVDDSAAQAYRASAPEDRRKLERLLNIRLRDYLQHPESFEIIMHQMSIEAIQNGLTPEALQDILSNEG